MPPKLYAVIVHHSDSDAMTLDQCNEWHRARGWDSCGYNFIIQRDGTVNTSRGWNKVGAHCKGFNSSFLGVCFVGKDLATPEQIKAFREWFGDRPFFGHKNFGKTLCPGKMLEQLQSASTTKHPATEKKGVHRTKAQTRLSRGSHLGRGGVPYNGGSSLRGAK